MRIEEIFPKSGYRRFPFIIRIIASILVVTFLFQDAAWAYPDNLQIQLRTSRDNFKPAFYVRYLVENAKAIAEIIDRYNPSKLDDILKWKGASDKEFALATFQEVRGGFGRLKEVLIKVGEKHDVILRYATNPVIPADDLVSGSYWGIDKEYDKIGVFRELLLSRKLVDQLGRDTDMLRLSAPIKNDDTVVEEIPAESVPDGNELSKYIDKLRGRESLKMMLMNPRKWEISFFKPIRELFFKRMGSDFKDSDDFVNICRKILADPDNGAYRLRKAMNGADPEILGALKKIKSRGKVNNPSMSFFGLAFHCLTSNPGPYVAAVYDAVLPKNATAEITEAKMGFSYHSMIDSGVHSYPEKGIIFEGGNANYRQGLRLRHREKVPDMRLSSENSKKIRLARSVWQEKWPSKKDDVNVFFDIGTVVEISGMDTYLLFSDPGKRVACPIHVGRHGHVVYFSKKYLDSLDINNEDDMAELAFWLNLGQEFLKLHDDMLRYGRSFTEINNALVELAENYLLRKNPIIDPRKIQRKLRGVMRHDTSAYYKDVMDKLVSESSAIDLCLETGEHLAGFKKTVESIKLDQRDRAHGRLFNLANTYGGLRNECRHLLYRYESLGMHEWATKSFRAMKVATEAVQICDAGGYRPVAFQIDMVFDLIRFGEIDDIITALETLLTGRGYPRKLKRTEFLDLRDSLTAGYRIDPATRRRIPVLHSFENELMASIAARLEVEPDKKKGKDFDEEVNRLLDSYFENRFGDVDPDDIEEEEGCVYRDTFVDDEGRLDGNKKFKVDIKYAGRKVRVIAKRKRWWNGFDVYCGIERIAEFRGTGIIAFIIRALRAIKRTIISLRKDEGGAASAETYIRANLEILRKAIIAAETSRQIQDDDIAAAGKAVGRMPWIARKLSAHADIPVSNNGIAAMLIDLIEVLSGIPGTARLIRRAEKALVSIAGQGGDDALFTMFTVRRISESTGSISGVDFNPTAKKGRKAAIVVRTGPYSFAPVLHIGINGWKAPPEGLWRDLGAVRNWDGTLDIPFPKADKYGVCRIDLTIPREGVDRIDFVVRIADQYLKDRGADFFIEVKDGFIKMLTGLVKELAAALWKNEGGSVGPGRAEFFSSFRFAKVTDPKLKSKGFRYSMRQGDRRRYFHFRWNIFMSLDDQVIGNIKERAWVSNLVPRVKKIQDILAMAKGMKAVISEEDDEYIRYTLNEVSRVVGGPAIRRPDKKRQAGYAKAALGDYESGGLNELRHMYANLTRVIRYLEARKKEVEGIFKGLSAIMRSAYDWAAKDNAYISRMAVSRTGVNLYHLASMHEVKAPENEPELEGVEPLMREAIRHMNNIRNDAAMEAALTKARQAISESDTLYKFLGDFHSAYYGEIFAKAGEPSEEAVPYEAIKENTFNRTWLKYAAKSNLVRGAPAYWYTRFYQAVFIHRTIENPENRKERISSPLFEAATVLAQVLKIYDLQAILDSHALESYDKFENTRGFIRSLVDKRRLTGMNYRNVLDITKKEREDLVRVIGKDKTLGRKDVIALNRCAAVYFEGKGRQGARTVTDSRLLGGPGISFISRKHEVGVPGYVRFFRQLLRLSIMFMADPKKRTQKDAINARASLITEDFKVYYRPLVEELVKGKSYAYLWKSLPPKWVRKISGYPGDSYEEKLDDVKLTVLANLVKMNEHFIILQIANELEKKNELEEIAMIGSAYDKVRGDMPDELMKISDEASAKVRATNGFTATYGIGLPRGQYCKSRDDWDRVLVKEALPVEDSPLTPINYAALDNAIRMYVFSPRSDAMVENKRYYTDNEKASNVLTRLADIDMDALAKGILRMEEIERSDKEQSSFIDMIQRFWETDMGGKILSHLRSIGKNPVYQSSILLDEEDAAKESEDNAFQVSKKGKKISGRRGESGPSGAKSFPARKGLHLHEDSRTEDDPRRSAEEIVRGLNGLQRQFKERYHDSAAEVEVLFSILPLDESSAYFAGQLYGVVISHDGLALSVPGGTINGQSAVRGDMKGPIGNTGKDSNIKFTLPASSETYRKVKGISAKEETVTALNDLVMTARILIKGGVPDKKHIVVKGGEDILDIMRLLYGIPDMKPVSTLGELAKLPLLPVSEPMPPRPDQVKTAEDAPKPVPARNGVFTEYSHGEPFIEFSLIEPPVKPWKYEVKQGAKVGNADVPKGPADILPIIEHVIREEEKFLAETFKNIFDIDLDRSKIEKIRVAFLQKGGIKHAFTVHVTLKNAKEYVFSVKTTHPTLIPDDRINLINSVHLWSRARKGAAEYVSVFGSQSRVYIKDFSREIIIMSQEYVYGPMLKDILDIDSVPFARKAGAVKDAVDCYLAAHYKYGLPIWDPRPENICLVYGSRKNWKLMDMDKIYTGSEYMQKPVRTREEYLEILSNSYGRYLDFSIGEPVPNLAGISLSKDDDIHERREEVEKIIREISIGQSLSEDACKKMEKLVDQLMARMFKDTPNGNFAVRVIKEKAGTVGIKLICRSYKTDVEDPSEFAKMQADEYIIESGNKRWEKRSSGVFVEPGYSTVSTGSRVCLTVNFTDKDMVAGSQENLAEDTIDTINPVKVPLDTPVEEGPAREMAVVLPAPRHDHIGLHIDVSDDLEWITYSIVDNDNDKDVFKEDGTVDYGALKLKELIKVPSSRLVTPQRFIENNLKGETRETLLRLLSEKKRYTRYKGITTSWDALVDKDTWTTNIDTAFMHKRMEELGIFDRTDIKSVIEIGVGGGHLSAALAARLPNLKQISVTDISLYALRAARRCIEPYLGLGKKLRCYFGKGIKTVEGAADLVVVNPPYIPTPPFVENKDGDPYRGTGLIREILKEGLSKLNKDNSEAQILINISSMAQKDWDRYCEEFKDYFTITPAGPPLEVPLKIWTIASTPEWTNWLVQEGGLKFNPQAKPDEEPYSHTIQVYSIKPKSKVIESKPVSEAKNISSVDRTRNDELIGRVTTAVRDFRFQTCLANSCMLIYLLRALGEKADLMGMYSIAEDMPFQYMVSTEKWGIIDISPYDEDRDDYERTEEAGKYDYEQGVAYLRNAGYITRADKMLKEGYFRSVDTEVETSEVLSRSMLPGFEAIDPGNGRIRYEDNFEPEKLSYELSVIAHGMTKNNEKKILHGSRTDNEDSVLTEEGQRQALSGAAAWWDEYGKDFVKHPGDYVFVVSPIIRAKQTFQIYKDYIEQRSSGVPVSFTEDEGVEEIDFGAWDGFRPDQLEGSERQLAERYRAGDAFVRSSNGGESFEDLMRRVHDWMRRGEDLYKGKKVFAVGHGTWKTAASIIMRTGSVIEKEGYIDWLATHYAENPSRGKPTKMSGKVSNISMRAEPLRFPPMELDTVSAAIQDVSGRLAGGRLHPFGPRGNVPSVFRKQGDIGMLSKSSSEASPHIALCEMFGSEKLSAVYFESLLSRRIPDSIVSKGGIVPIMGVGRVQDRIHKLISYLHTLDAEEKREVMYLTEAALRSIDFEKRSYDDYEYMYGLRDIARNLEIEAARYLQESTPSNIILRRHFRGVAYIFEYLSFAYEKMVYDGREAIMRKDPNYFFDKYYYLTNYELLFRIGTMPLYHEQFNKDIATFLKNKDLRLMKPEGSKMTAYSAPDIDFVVKILKEGAVAIDGAPATFKSDIFPGAELAKERLGGLGADFVFFEDQEVTIDGKVIFVREGLIQRKTTVLKDKITQLAKAGDIEGVKTILRKWFELQKNMWSRRVLDEDIKLLDNYGFDEATGEVVLIDFTNISADREKYFVEPFTSFITYHNIANVTGLNAISPGLGELYMNASFDAFQMSGKSFEDIWPEFDNLHEESFRIPMSEPSIISVVFRSKIRRIFHDALETVSERVITQTFALLNNLRSSENDSSGIAAAAGDSNKNIFSPANDHKTYEILVLCSQNKERSPLSAHIMRSNLPDDLQDKIIIKSAALDPMIETPDVDGYTTRHAVLRNHTPRQASEKDFQLADIILVMTEAQKEDLENRYPDTKGKVYRILDEEDLHTSTSDYLVPDSTLLYQKVSEKIEANLDKIFSKIRRIISVRDNSDKKKGGGKQKSQGMQPGDSVSMRAEPLRFPPMELDTVSAAIQDVSGRLADGRLHPFGSRGNVPSVNRDGSHAEPRPVPAANPDLSPAVINEANQAGTGLGLGSEPSLNLSTVPIENIVVIDDDLSRLATYEELYPRNVEGVKFRYFSVGEDAERFILDRSNNVGLVVTDQDLSRTSKTSGTRIAYAIRNSEEPDIKGLPVIFVSSGSIKTDILQDIGNAGYYFNINDAIGRINQLIQESNPTLLLRPSAAPTEGLAGGSTEPMDSKKLLMQMPSGVRALLEDGLDPVQVALLDAGSVPQSPWMPKSRRMPLGMRFDQKSRDVEPKKNDGVSLNRTSAETAAGIGAAAQTPPAGDRLQADSVPCTSVAIGENARANPEVFDSAAAPHRISDIVTQAQAKAFFVSQLTKALSVIPENKLTRKKLDVALNSRARQIFRALTIYQREGDRQRVRDGLLEPDAFKVTNYRPEYSQWLMCNKAAEAFCEAFSIVFRKHKVCWVRNKRGNHDWALIDDKIAVDLTYGQWDDEYLTKALVVTKEKSMELDLLGEYEILKEYLPLPVNGAGKTGTATVFTSPAAPARRSPKGEGWADTKTPPGPKELREMNKFGLPSGLPPKERFATGRPGGDNIPSDRIASSDNDIVDYTLRWIENDSRFDEGGRYLLMASFAQIAYKAPYAVNALLDSFRGGICDLTTAKLYLNSESALTGVFLTDAQVEYITSIVTRFIGKIPAAIESKTAENAGKTMKAMIDTAKRFNETTTNLDRVGMSHRGDFNYMGHAVYAVAEYHKDPHSIEVLEAIMEDIVSGHPDFINEAGQGKWLFALESGRLPYREELVRRGPVGIASCIARVYDIEVADYVKSVNNWDVMERIIEQGLKNNSFSREDAIGYFVGIHTRKFPSNRVESGIRECLIVWHNSGLTYDELLKAYQSFHSQDKGELIRKDGELTKAAFAVENEMTREAFARIIDEHPSAENILLIGGCAHVDDLAEWAGRSQRVNSGDSGTLSETSSGMSLEKREESSGGTGLNLKMKTSQETLDLFANLDVDTVLLEAWRKISEVGSLDDIRAMNVYEFAKRLGCKEVDESELKMSNSPIYYDPMLCEIRYSPLHIERWTRGKSGRPVLGKSAFVHELFEKALHEAEFLAEFYTGKKSGKFHNADYFAITDHASPEIRKHEALFAALMDEEKETGAVVYGLNADLVNLCAAYIALKGDYWDDKVVKLRKLSDEVRTLMHELESHRKELKEEAKRVWNEALRIDSPGRARKIYDADDIPSMALRDISAQNRPADYFRKGDYLVVNAKGQMGFVTSVLTKGVVVEVDQKKNMIEIEPVEADGVLTGLRGPFDITNKHVWKWDAEKASFVPAGKRVRKPVYIPKLGLPDDIEHKLMYGYRILTVEELENVPEIELAEAFGKDNSALIKNVLETWRKKTDAMPAEGLAGDSTDSMGPKKLLMQMPSGVRSMFENELDPLQTAMLDAGSAPQSPWMPKSRRMPLSMRFNQKSSGGEPQEPAKPILSAANVRRNNIEIEEHVRALLKPLEPRGVERRRLAATMMAIRHAAPSYYRLLENVQREGRLKLYSTQNIAQVCRYIREKGRVEGDEERLSDIRAVTEIVVEKGVTYYRMIIDEKEWANPPGLFATIVHEMAGHIAPGEQGLKFNDYDNSEEKAFAIEEEALKQILSDKNSVIYAISMIGASSDDIAWLQKALDDKALQKIIKIDTAKLAAIRAKITNSNLDGAIPATTPPSAEPVEKIHTASVTETATKPVSSGGEGNVKNQKMEPVPTDVTETGIVTVAENQAASPATAPAAAVNMSSEAVEAREGAAPNHSADTVTKASGSGQAAATREVTRDEDNAVIKRRFGANVRYNAPAGKPSNGPKKELEKAFAKLEAIKVSRRNFLKTAASAWASLSTGGMPIPTSVTADPVMECFEKIKCLSYANDVNGLVSRCDGYRRDFNEWQNWGSNMNQTADLLSSELHMARQECNDCVRTNLYYIELFERVLTGKGDKNYAEGILMRYEELYRAYMTFKFQAQRSFKRLDSPDYDPKWTREDIERRGKEAVEKIRHTYSFETRVRALLHLLKNEKQTLSDIEEQFIIPAENVLRSISTETNGVVQQPEKGVRPLSEENVNGDGSHAEPRPVPAANPDLSPAVIKAVINEAKEAVTGPGSYSEPSPDTLGMRFNQPSKDADLTAAKPQFIFATKEGDLIEIDQNGKAIRFIHRSNRSKEDILKMWREEEIDEAKIRVIDLAVQKLSAQKTMESKAKGPTMPDVETLQDINGPFGPSPGAPSSYRFATGRLEAPDRMAPRSLAEVRTALLRYIAEYTRDVRQDSKFRRGRALLEEARSALKGTPLEDQIRSASQSLTQFFQEAWYDTEFHRADSANNLRISEPPSYPTILRVRALVASLNHNVLLEDMKRIVPYYQNVFLLGLRSQYSNEFYAKLITFGRSYDKGDVESARQVLAQIKELLKEPHPYRVYRNAFVEDLAFRLDTLNDYINQSPAARQTEKGAIPQRDTLQPQPTGTSPAPNASVKETATKPVSSVGNGNVNDKKEPLPKDVTETGIVTVAENQAVSPATAPAAPESDRVSQNRTSTETTIVDIGATAETVSWFRSRYPNGTIIAIQPELMFNSPIKDNAALINDPKIHVVTRRFEDWEVPDYLLHKVNDVYFILPESVFAISGKTWDKILQSITTKLDLVLNETSGRFILLEDEDELIHISKFQSALSRLGFQCERREFMTLQEAESAFGVLASSPTYQSLKLIMQDKNSPGVWRSMKITALVAKRKKMIDNVLVTTSTAVGKTAGKAGTATIFPDSDPTAPSAEQQTKTSITPWTGANTVGPEKQPFADAETPGQFPKDMEKNPPDGRGHGFAKRIEEPQPEPGKESVVAQNAAMRPNPEITQRFEDLLSNLEDLKVSRRSFLKAAAAASMMPKGTIISLSASMPGEVDAAAKFYDMIRPMVHTNFDNLINLTKRFVADISNALNTERDASFIDYWVERSLGQTSKECRKDIGRRRHDISMFQRYLAGNVSEDDIGSYFTRYAQMYREYTVLSAWEKAGGEPEDRDIDLKAEAAFKSVPPKVKAEGLIRMLEAEIGGYKEVLNRVESGISDVYELLRRIVAVSQQASEPLPPQPQPAPTIGTSGIEPMKPSLPVATSAQPFTTPAQAGWPAAPEVATAREGVRPIQSFDRLRVDAELLSKHQREIDAVGQTPSVTTTTEVWAPDVRIDKMLTSIHSLTKDALAVQPIPSNSVILLSETLFDLSDREHLKGLLGENSPVRIVSAKEMRNAALNAKTTKENLVCVMKTDDYNNEEAWNDGQKSRNKATLIILGEDLSGGRYLYLEGVIGLAHALMTNDMDRARVYLDLLFNKTADIDDAALLKCIIENPERLADYIRFKPTTPFDGDELPKEYKIKVEDFVTAA